LDVQGGVAMRHFRQREERGSGTPGSAARETLNAQMLRCFTAFRMTKSSLLIGAANILWPMADGLARWLDGRRIRR